MTGVARLTVIVVEIPAVVKLFPLAGVNNALRVWLTPAMSTVPAAGE